MKNFVFLFSLIIGLVLTQSCSKDDDDNDVDDSTPLKVVTEEVTNLTSSSVTLNGEVVEGSVIGLKKGFVYSRFENPYFDDTKVSVTGAELGKFSHDLTGLPNNAQYYVKAYAINNKDTVLGDQVEFKTNL